MTRLLCIQFCLALVCGLFLVTACSEDSEHVAGPVGGGLDSRLLKESPDGHVAVGSPVRAYWSFNEPTPRVAKDGSVYLNYAVPGGDGTAVVSGQDGRARHFRGHDWLVVAPDSSLAPLNAITVEAWIHPTRLGTYQYEILTKESGGIGTYHLMIRPDDCLLFGINRAGNQWANLKASTPLELNKWTHVAATFDNVSKVCVLYYDFRPVARSILAHAFLHATDDSIYIGRNGSGDRFHFYGYMDEVRITSAVKTFGQ